MIYRINQDETNVRWTVINDDPRSECTGMIAYNRYEQARQAAFTDARALGAQKITITTRGHEPQLLEVTEELS